MSTPDCASIPDRGWKPKQGLLAVDKSWSELTGQEKSAYSDIGVVPGE